MILSTLLMAFITYAATPSLSPVSTPSRTSNWDCELNAFAAGASEQQVLKYPELSGKGLVICKTASGFTTDFPIEMRLQVSRDPKMSMTSKMKVTVSSEPFIVNKDFHRYYGKYEAEGLPMKMQDQPNVSMLFRGQNSDLVMPLKFSVPRDALGDWQIDTVTITLLE